MERYSGFDTVADFVNDGPEYYYRKNLWPSQNSYVECWFEKGAIMSVVERLHTKYQVTMRPFRGHASRTRIVLTSLRTSP